MARIPTREDVYGAISPVPRGGGGVVRYRGATDVSDAVAAGSQEIERVGARAVSFGESMLAEQQKQARRDAKEQRMLIERTDNLNRTKMLYELKALEDKYVTLSEEQGDYDKIVNDFSKETEVLKKKYDKAFKSEYVKEKANVDFFGRKSLAAGRIENIVRKRYKDDLQATAMETLSDVELRLSRSKDVDEIKELSQVGFDLIENGTPNYNDSRRVMARKRFKSQVAKASVMALPVEDRINLIKSAMDSGAPKAIIKEDAIAFTLNSLEGGDKLVKEPDGSYSFYGINTKNYPELEEKIKSGDLSYADAYKIADKEYWSRVEKYPEQIRPIAFDFLFNGFDPKVLGYGYKEAIKKANGDPDKLLDIRDEYYTKLYESNPEKWGGVIAGWKNRVENLREFVDVASVTGTPLDFLNRGEIENIRNLTLAEYKDQVADMGFEELAAVMSGANIPEGLDESDVKSIKVFASKVMDSNIAETAINNTSRAIDNIADIYTKIEDGTITQSDIEAAVLENKDDPATLGLLSDIKKNLGMNIEDVSKKKYSPEVKEKALLNLYDSMKQLGLEVKGNKVKDTDGFENITQLHILLKNVEEARKVGALSPKQSAQMTLAFRDRLRDLVSAPQIGWFGATKLEKIKRADPNFVLFDIIRSNMIAENPSLNGDTDTKINLYRNVIDNYYSLPDEVKGDERLRVAVGEAVKQSFPSLKVADSLPDRFVDQYGREIKLPSFLVGYGGDSPQPDIIIEDNTVIRDYATKDGDVITRDDILKTAEKRGVPPSVIVNNLKERGIIND